MQKIGLVVNQKKTHAVELSRSLRKWLEGQEKKVEDNLTMSIEELIPGKDLLICFGGDGTILHVANCFIKSSVPVLGINVGALGFLTEVKPREAEEELSRIFKGEYTIEERLMIRARIRRGGKREPEVMQGLNDIVIARENLARYLKVNILADGEALMEYSGDGVIVSTPTGSTAYSLSAGGPLVYPTLDSFVITPLCAHGLLMRPIVLPSDKKISIKLVSEKEMKRAVITADGQRHTEIISDDEITIERSPLSFPLIVSSRRSYLRLLQEKLGMCPIKD